MKLDVKHMMVIKSVFLLLVMTFSLSSYAEGKIGVIDLQRALGSADVSKQQFSALKNDAQFKDHIEKIKLLKVELQELQKEGETNSLTWSDAQKKQQIQKMQAKVTQLNNYADQSEKIKAQVENNIAKELLPKIEEVVNQVIKEKGIGLLLNSQAVYYRTAEFDITSEVLERVNKLK